MMTFYLNDCICAPVNDLKQDDLIIAFCAFITAYVHYKGDNKEEYRMILKCDPKNLKVGDKTITELIHLIPRDYENEPLRKKAYSMFNNYPSNQYIKGHNAWKDEEWQSYVFLDQDADNLFVAHKENWCIASIPIRNEVKVNPLSIVGKQDNKSVEILNWFVDNSYEIKCVEFSRLDEREKALKTLPYYFSGKRIICSEEFVSQFMNPHCDVSENVINRLHEAYKAGLLFPANYDDNIVKKCEGKGNDMTYELRQKGSGLRAYFYCDEQRLILASLHTKAESSGSEQSDDISHASKIIADLLT
ncbi:MAG: hypothetical protein MJZ84_02305 [Paludibacteraceae bacterium]|nr:hypothetical protein [Paludibacteraceae bacterium]